MIVELGHFALILAFAVALVQATLPLYGVQYHPESILTEFGLPLLKNWLQLAGIHPKALTD